MLNKFNKIAKFVIKNSSKNGVEEVNFNKTRDVRLKRNAGLSLFEQNDNVTYFLVSLKRYILFLEKFKKKIIKVNEYNESLQKELDIASNEMLLAAYRIEKELSLSIRNELRGLFRSAIGKYLYESKILKRFYEKPRGYPGDYLMFEMIYDNQPISKKLGHYFDKYTLAHIMVQSVRNRKEMMKQLLTAYINENNKQSVEILNIACGSCREIKELLYETTFNKNVKYIFLDQDKEALSFANKSLPHSNTLVEMSFLQNDILGTLGWKTEKRMPEMKKKDIIYSMGVVDYFGDNIFERFIKHFYQFLNPGGRLIIAVCGSRNLQNYVALRWFCEWNFFTREEKNMERIIKDNLGINSVEIKKEKNQQIFFIVIHKEI